MRIDDSSLGEPSRECPTAAQLVELFQTAYPITWEQLLCQRLRTLGVADPTDLPPAKLAEFRVPDRGSGNPTPLGGMGSRQ